VDVVLVVDDLGFPQALKVGPVGLELLGFREVKLRVPVVGGTLPGPFEHWSESADRCTAWFRYPDLHQASVYLGGVPDSIA
jgi:hypothetical protein